MSRGGKRKGAGRKCRSPKGPRLTFNCRVDPETKAVIEELKEKGVNIGPEFDKFIARLNTSMFFSDFEKEFGEKRK